MSHTSQKADAHTVTRRNNLSFTTIWAPFQYKDHFSGISIPIMKIRPSLDPIIFIMGIAILVIRRFYIERAPWCNRSVTQYWVWCSSMTCRYTRTADIYSKHWSRDKMAAIFQTTISNAFSWMNMHEFWLKFHRRLFLRVQLTISQHWFR